MTPSGLVSPPFLPVSLPLISFSDLLTSDTRTPVITFFSSWFISFLGFDFVASSVYIYLHLPRLLSWCIFSLLYLTVHISSLFFCLQSYCTHKPQSHLFFFPVLSFPFLSFTTLFLSLHPSHSHLVFSFYLPSSPSTLTPHTTYPTVSSHNLLSAAHTLPLLLIY